MQRNNCAFRRLFHFWHANDHICVVTILYTATTALYIYEQIRRERESATPGRLDLLADLLFDARYINICKNLTYTLGEKMACPHTRGG